MTSGPNLPGHANGMILMATDAQGDVILQETYYSIGGGFVMTEAELAAGRDTDNGDPVPYPFKSAAEMLEMAETSGKTIAGMKKANEISRGGPANLTSGVARIWEVMNTCIERGITTDGTLPGGLKVKRRAKAIHDALLAERGTNIDAPHKINDWISTYAMAVNEENAAGGQVVTAPTNGAAGVVPAVIRYWLDHVPGATEAKIETFLLTRRGNRRAGEIQCLDFGRRGRLPGRGGQRRRNGRCRACGGHGRHPPRRSRTPPRSHSNITSG